MIRPRLFSLLFLLISAATTGYCAELPAEAILKRADETRTPRADYSYQVKVVSYRANKEQKEALYEIYSKGGAKTVVTTLAPASDRGRVLLMRENDLWAFMPEVSKPFRISARERLIGEVSNADIVRSNFFGDYQAGLIKIEKINEKEHYALRLVAKREDVPYSKILLWVEKNTFRPLQAQLYGMSGRILKSCRYEKYAMLGGRMRPTRLTLVDAYVKGQYSTIDYSAMKLTPLPDKFFTDDYLKKLSK